MEKDKKSNKPWPYWVGGILLGVLNSILFFLTDIPWKVSSSLLYLGVGILEKLGFNPSGWYYFSVYSHGLKDGETFLNNPIVIMALGIVVGSLMSVLFSSQFKYKRLKNKNQFFWAILGGSMMGYGTRIAFGCNIGAYFSAIPSMSAHGFVFGAFMFLGAYIGSKILYKYIL